MEDPLPPSASWPRSACAASSRARLCSKRSREWLLQRPLARVLDSVSGDSHDLDRVGIDLVHESIDLLALNGAHSGGRFGGAAKGRAIAWREKVSFSAAFSFASLVRSRSAAPPGNILVHLDAQLDRHGDELFLEELLARSTSHAAGQSRTLRTMALVASPYGQKMLMATDYRQGMS